MRRERRRGGRAARRIFLGLLAILVLGLGGGFLWLRSSLPETTGTLHLAGLSGRVQIGRDAQDIPTIRAENDRDAMFALGFVHAQERLFEMDLYRHLGAGRLSEWFGNATIATDRNFRVLGLYRAAESQYALLSPALQAVLDSYAAGVNAFLSERRGALPPEYYLLNTTPEPWRPADSLVWIKFMDLQLAGNYRGELARARMLKHLSPADLDILYPPASAHDDPHTELLRGLALEAPPPEIGPRYASNNWVVAGNRSASGKPLLANDPHLGFSSPSLWYLVTIETPDTKLAGVTLPGAPFVLIGHNARIAWGLTTTTGDVEDLYIEKLDPEDPTRYLTPSGPQPFLIRHEDIKVKGEPSVPLDIRASRHGPIISDLDGTAATGTVLALKATFLMEDDRTPDALWGVVHAGDWHGFREALKMVVAPQQNVVYADVDGNIGFIAPARIPIRAKGDGFLPVPGWSDEYEWTGFIPFDALPSAFNPPSGRIVTANNKIVPDNYPYFISRDWDIPNRAQRITELLDAKTIHDPDTMAMIQADTLSPMARTLLPLLLAPAPHSPRAAEAVERLRAWDLRMDRDQVAPLLFTAWLRELNRTLFAERLGPDFEAYWSLRHDIITNILESHREWCGKSCDEAIALSLDHALAGLEAELGPDMASWRWGQVHEALFTHPFWSRVPLFNRVIDPKIPADGGYDTINRGATLINGAAPYADVHGSTLRMIVDMAEDR